jgi:hypothetical protein
VTAIAWIVFATKQWPPVAPGVTSIVCQNVTAIARDSLCNQAMATGGTRCFVNRLPNVTAIAHDSLCNQAMVTGSTRIFVNRLPNVTAIARDSLCNQAMATGSTRCFVNVKFRIKHMSEKCFIIAMHTYV